MVVTSVRSNEKCKHQEEGAVVRSMNVNFRSATMTIAIMSSGCSGCAPESVPSSADGRPTGASTDATTIDGDSTTGMAISGSGIEPGDASATVGPTSDGADSSSGTPGSEDPSGVVFIEGQSSFVAVAIPSGHAEALSGRSFQLSTDRVLVSRTFGSEQGIETEFFVADGIAEEPLARYVRPDSWVHRRFFTQDFMVGELEIGGYERRDLDGGNPQRYSVPTSIPPRMLTSIDGESMAWCDESDGNAIYREYAIDEDGLAEVWSQTIEGTECATGLGRARDGSVFYAEADDFQWSQCLAFGPTGELLAEASFPGGVDGAGRGPGVLDDEVAISSSQFGTLVRVRPDCSTDALSAESFPIERARLDTASGMWSAAVVAADDGSSTLQLVETDSLDEIVLEFSIQSLDWQTQQVSYIRLDS